MRLRKFIKLVASLTLVAATVLSTVGCDASSTAPTTVSASAASTENKAPEKSKDKIVMVWYLEQNLTLF